MENLTGDEEMKRLQVCLHSHSKGDRMLTRLLAVVAITLFVGAILGADIILNRNVIFDDAFITYRYAKNLAQGHGITWNVGEAPVEGYTNFLLVVLLAPFIRLGLDPLLITRLLSILAAIGLLILFYRFARETCSADRQSAWLIGLSLLAATPTAFLCMLGLETVLYAFMLSMSFYLANRFLARDRIQDLWGSNLAGFAAFLLRPEAPLLSLCVGGVVLLSKVRQPGLLRFVVRGWGASWCLPMGIYLGWKLIHFGTLLPNAFFIKAAGGEWISYAGIGSIAEFISNARVMLLLAALSAPTLSSGTLKKTTSVALFFLGGYLTFYTRVDTLMDAHGRFLYPLFPFVWFLALPTLTTLFSAGRICGRRTHVRVLVMMAAFVFLTTPNVWSSYVKVRQAIRGADFSGDKNELMQKEYLVARTLSEYAHVSEVRIAFSDAGVIPYFTGAPTLDVVGLNDAFIARERNLGKLVDYFFSCKPTLVLHPSNKDCTWIAYDHGPLGNYPQWSNDPRWDNYAYVGTIKTSGRMYDVQMLLRKDYADFAGFSEFLRQKVADIVLETFPLSLGSSAHSRSAIGQ